MVLVENVSEDFAIKEGHMVTMEILFNEIAVESNEYTHEINKNPVLAEEVVSDLVADQVEEVLTLLNEYNGLQHVRCAHLAKMKIVLKNN